MNSDNMDLARINALNTEALAINTRTVGMVAENKARVNDGLSPAYTEEDYEGQARQLDGIAYRLNEMCHG